MIKAEEIWSESYFNWDHRKHMAGNRGKGHNLKKPQ